MKKKLRKQIQNQYPWWDEHYLIQMIEDWLKHSSEMHSKHGHLVRSDRTAKEMKISANLLHRINNHDYAKPNKVLPCRNNHIKEDTLGLGLEAFDYNPKENELKKQDVDYLFDFMKKHILTWWD